MTVLIFYNILATAYQGCSGKTVLSKHVQVVLSTYDKNQPVAFAQILSDRMLDSISLANHN